MTVFSAVVSWIMVDAGSRKQFFASLLGRPICSLSLPLLQQCCSALQAANQQCACTQPSAAVTLSYSGIVPQSALCFCMLSSLGSAPASSPLLCPPAAAPLCNSAPAAQQKSCTICVPAAAEKGVRLDRMSRDDLYLVDVHPLVVSSHEASMAVARVFLHRLMGSSWGPSSPVKDAALQQLASEPFQPAGGAAGSNGAQVPSLSLQAAVGQEATPCTGLARSTHFSRSASQQSWLITPASDYEAGRLSVLGDWPGPTGAAMQQAATQPASAAGEVHTHVRQALSSPVQHKQIAATAGSCHSSQLSERPAASMSKRRRLSFDD